MLSPHCNRWEKEKIAAFLANPGPLHDQPMREVVAWLPQARRFAWAADADLNRATPV